MTEHSMEDTQPGPDRHELTRPDGVAPPHDPPPVSGSTRGESPAGFSSWAATRSKQFSRLMAVPGLAPLLAGVAAIIAASIGEYIVRPGDTTVFNPDLGTAMRWYAAGIIILLMGWWGTYRNYSLLHFPPAGRWLPRLRRRQLGLLIVSLLVCLLSLLILRGNWASIIGGLLWVASLLLLVAAFLGEPGAETADVPPADTESWRLPRWAELAVFGLIMACALGLRLWRLGDLAVGMHGDEGEAGSDALAILHGAPAPLFARGWFNQPNMYYWALAIFMKIFGTGLFGLRSFAMLCGLVAVVFTYLLGREMFGQRGGIIAGSFMAFQSAALEFSREEFSNASTPAFMAMSFYFALRGLRTRRHLDFVLSGFAAGFSLYFYAGGRLTAPLLIAFFGYLVVMRPRFVKHYWSRVVAYVAGLALISMPFVAYYLAFPINGLQYPNDRFIWYHHADLAVKYGSADWRVIVWDQFQATISIITQSADVSAFGALTFPIARPVEAPLIVLGLAWAIWRLADTRFFALSLWFWASIVAAGVITIDAPNLPRIMAMLPVLPLAIAAILDHLIALATRAGERVRAFSGPRPGRWVVGAVVACAMIGVGALENWQIYIVSYLNTPQNIVTTAQALYVQQQGPAYRFYGMGAPLIYWTHGDNRFINPDADGIDAGNLPEYLPITDNGAAGHKPANFLVWPPDYDYLSVLRSYYPAGQTHTVPLGNARQPNQPLLGFIVPTSQIEARRTVGARFVDAAGVVVERRQSTLGLFGSALPGGLKFPIKATWDGSLFADTYGTYRFEIVGPPGTQFSIDGVPGIFPSGSTIINSVVLARGLHAVHLFAPIDGPHTTVTVRWAAGTAPLAPVSQRSLWDDNTVRGWNGLIRVNTIPIAGHTPPPVLVERRMDGFLGFRNLGQLFGPGPLDGHWSSILTVTKRGEYGFRLNVTGDVSMNIDGHTILQGTAPGSQPQLVEGAAELNRGRHTLDVRIHWPGPFDYLEAYWSPPGKSYRILLTPDLQPQKPAIWLTAPPVGAP